MRTNCKKSCESVNRMHITSKSWISYIFLRYIRGCISKATFSFQLWKRSYYIFSCMLKKWNVFTAHIYNVWVYPRQIILVSLKKSIRNETGKKKEKKIHEKYSQKAHVWVLFNANTLIKMWIEIFISDIFLLHVAEAKYFLLWWSRNFSKKIKRPVACRLSGYF